MLTVLELESVFLMGSPLLPGGGWVIGPVPALTGSLADRRDPHREELRQGAECGRVPAERSLSYHTVILLVVGQFAGVMILNVWILLGLSIVCALLARLLLQRAVKRFLLMKCC